MSRTWPVTMGRSGIQMIENLQIYDMVWGMANLNRFTGKSDRNVSVLNHCLHCYEIADIWQPDNENLKLYALTHDMPEAYYGDFPGFLKKHLGADFEYALDRIDDVVFDQLGLPRDLRLALESDLKRIDENALSLEAEYAFERFEPYHWPTRDLFDDIGLTNDIFSGDDQIASYNLYISTLDHMGNENEVLRNLLYRHRSYSHPVRLR